ncbi:9823_t:CDS:2, partial [Dentiscutata erythropus]
QAARMPVIPVAIPVTVAQLTMYLIVGGYSWHQCVNGEWIFEESRALLFNHENDLSCYPLSPCAATFKNTAVQDAPNVTSLGIRSIISDYDTSQLFATAIGAIPKPDLRDIPLGIEKTSNNSGTGAFSDITYIVRPKTKGGNAPTIP